MGVKVVYNASFGGFGLSDAAKAWLRERGCDKEWWAIPRHDPLLVECVETLGGEASGSFAALMVLELRGRRYRIQEYDGRETVLEPEDLLWIEA